MPHPEESRYCRAFARAEKPRLLVVEFARRAVEAHYRREHPELHPSHLKLLVVRPEHVPADVVAPPAVTDIRRRGGKVGLEGEARPGDEGIAGEAHRVAVAARAAVAGEGEPRVAVPGGVEVNPIPSIYINPTRTTRSLRVAF